jgi:transcriptional regulator with XRE-family HTH domain
MSTAPPSILIKKIYTGTFPDNMTQRELKKLIAARLDAVRRAHGWANNFFAKQAGISEQQWRNYKMGDNFVPTPHLLRMIAITGIRSEYILENDRSRIPAELLERIQKAEADPNWVYQAEPEPRQPRRRRA